MNKHEYVSRVEIPVQKMVGRYRLYSAKIGTMSSSLVAIKRYKNFWIGQRIEFKEYRPGDDLRFAKWQVGRIWDINTLSPILYIERA